MAKASSNGSNTSSNKRVRELKLPKGIRRRSNGKLIVEISFQGIRRSETVNTVDEAMRARERLMNTLTHEHKDKQAAAETWTMQEALDRAASVKWKGVKSYATAIRNATEAVNYFGAQTPISTITTEDVDKYVMFLEGSERRNSDATVNRKLSALSVMLDLAHKRKKIKTMPEFTRRKESEGRIRFLTHEEEKQLIGWFIHLGKPDQAEACTVLLDTGFRCSELWGLAAHGVNLTNRTLTIWTTKTDKPRTIPMTKRVYEIIARRCGEHQNSPLFNGSSNDWLSHHWKRVRELMGLSDDPDFVPHALRHTCCSRLVQRGVPLNHVQAWMGHKAIQTTMRYAHLAPHDLFALAHVLDGGETARWQAMSGDIE